MTQSVRYPGIDQIINLHGEWRRKPRQGCNRALIAVSLGLQEVGRSLSIPAFRTSAACVGTRYWRQTRRRPGQPLERTEKSTAQPRQRLRYPSQHLACVQTSISMVLNTLKA